MIFLLIIVIFTNTLAMEAGAAIIPEIEGRMEKLEFLVTNKNEIWRVQENGDRHQYSTNASAIGDVDYHLGKNILFWIDSGKHEIHSQPLDVNSIRPSKTFKQPRNWEPVALAVDFIGDKIYVADVCGVKIDVFELNGRHHSIALGINLIRPLDIKLDPYERWMLILDGSRILSTSIDGSSQVSIVARGIRITQGLSIDITDKKIYWSRNRNFEIMSSNYFGKNVSTLGKSASSSIVWSKFTIFNANIFWASNFIRLKSVCCDKSLSFYQHRTVYHCNPVPTIKTLQSLQHYAFSNPCDNGNGGCQHMCILISIRNNLNNYTHRCACNIGWMLAENLKNCTHMENVVMYAQSRIIKSHVIEPCNGTFCEPYLPIAEGDRSTLIIDFDYNFNDNYLYYIVKNEMKYDMIYKVHPNESESELFLIGERENYQSLAIDWTSTNLYYTSALKGTINVVDANNKGESVILLENLEQPEDIMLYFKESFLYFFQTNQSTKLTFFTRIRIDGSNLTIFNSVQLRKSCGYSIDSNDGNIYWYEWSKNGIRHSNLNLNDVQIIRSKLTKNLYSISVYEKWIYFATTNSEGLWRLDKNTGNESELIFADLGNRITKVKVFSYKEQSKNNNYLPIITNGGSLCHNSSSLYKKNVCN